ncbi:MAG: hypothetical protein KTR24_18445, partial [Saprospiraceae bacterium]|nr:hypothetical protein [Saprospiraceae bacterium]
MGREVMQWQRNGHGAKDPFYDLSAMQEKASKDLQHNTLTIERTTHHYTLGKLNADTKCIWLVCHGYGQTADRFIKNFETLPEGHFVIAPEAYNYFYWHSPGREPVASWMTRRHRKFEIQDYLAYLKKVCDAYQGVCPPQSRWIFFGFSQGCATITRFAFMANPDCKRLILWGGDFPRD